MTDAAFQANPDNYCYRHPDRQSFVLCQRCTRTICPECMTQMPVGVICPECLAAQRQASGQAHRENVARLPRRRSRTGLDTRPLATYVIVGVTLLLYLVTLIPGVGSTIEFYLAYNSALAVVQPWRMLTVVFVHASIFHVGLNMLALWALGRSLEPLLGRWRFVALYALSALGGSALVSLLAPGTWVVGASGAVWGLLGAMLVIGRHIGANVTAIAVLLGLNLVFTFLPGSNISWQAHIGGGLVGALVGFVFARTRKVRQRAAQTWLLVGIGAGLIAICVGSALVFFR
ncbi:rhomboid family intramembrane serine protease [Microbacterium telephonicum]|uniref:Membrane associated rhomboid family serine protease n=1 Tax=Microbacterium telephonicum TaxID=1714841 RepID=A0A498CFW6_9MICO|nr:rhomboid family intramembrane serine protease [Microbacterium telephonicum]RLK52210.1 membrane associated rhomboid family serine protease [Microbacterium telephonicum]